MDKKEFPQCSELGQGIVTRLNCPHSFLAIKADSNMGFLDHIDIICTITDSQRYLSQVVFDQPNNISLFFGRNSAADHTFTFGHDVLHYTVFQFFHCEQFS